jgi:hypothetical protein
MAFESDKIMFEIYRETEYTGKYRVVYFTELQDHNKESEINHALVGEHLYDPVPEKLSQGTGQGDHRGLPGAPE